VSFQLQVYYAYNLSPASLTQRSTPAHYSSTEKRRSNGDRLTTDATRVIVAAGSGPAVAAARERRMG